MQPLLSRLPPPSFAIVMATGILAIAARGPRPGGGVTSGKMAP